MLASLRFVERFITLPKKTVTTNVGGVELRYQHYDLDLISPLLTRQGFEVEAVTEYGAALRGVVVGRIESCAKHPSADKLQVCQVNIGGASNLQIVCGAANARQGLYVAVATVGTVLPGDKTIKAAAIRDVPSQGMLCARDELGLAVKESTDGKGIWELDVDAQGGQTKEVLQASLGKPVVDVLAIADVLLELNVTPNRPDMLSHRGVARELAAGFRSQNVAFELKNPRYANKESWSAPRLASEVLKNAQLRLDNVRISARNELGAPTFFLGLENVTVCETPAWLRNQLEALGQNSINAVVDASNYILLAYGQPSHAFDVRKLAIHNNETTVSLRFAKDKEKFVGLDGKERELTQNDGVVADDASVQALLGVLGGEHSKVDASTKNVLIEIANPSAVAVRRSSRRIGRITDASFAFEKGIDTSARYDACLELVGLIQSLTKSGSIVGAIHSKLVDKRTDVARDFISDDALEWACGPALKKAVCADFSLCADFEECAAWGAEWKEFATKLRNRYSVDYLSSHQTRVLGADLVNFEKSIDILESLGFSFSAKDKERARASVPSWRRLDIAGFPDLVEEISRVVGIDHIPSVAVSPNAQDIKDDKHIEVFERVANRCASLGYTEVIGLHFMREDDLHRLGLNGKNTLGTPVRLLNPIIQDEPLLHTTLVPDMLRKVAHNLNYGTKRGQLFQIARTFQNATREGNHFFESDPHPLDTSADYAPQLAFAYTAEREPMPRPAETPRLAGVVFGNKEEKTWYNDKAVPFDLHSVVSHVSEIVRALGLTLVHRTMEDGYPFARALHPGRRAQLFVASKDEVLELGWAGVFHPAALRNFGIEATCIGFEINLAQLYRAHAAGLGQVSRKLQPRRFPAVTRDFAFLLSDETSAQHLDSTVRSSLVNVLPQVVPATLHSVNIFDIYRGKGVPEGKKSVAFQLSLNPTERTLTDADIQKVTSATIEAVTKTLGGELRGG